MRHHLRYLAGKAMQAQNNASEHARDVRDLRTYEHAARFQSFVADRAAVARRYAAEYMAALTADRASNQ